VAHLDRAVEDAPPKDKYYRKYASGIERALSLFDTTLQEWADYISFLNRLLKVGSPQESCVGMPSLTDYVAVRIGPPSSTVLHLDHPRQGNYRKAVVAMSQPLAPLGRPPKDPRSL
jgi:hypothetical protein